MFVFYDWPFPHVYFAKNVAYFPFNSWLSFQRLWRLLLGFGDVILFDETKKGLHTDKKRMPTSP